MHIRVYKCIIPGCNNNLHPGVRVFSTRM
ncbi:MAG: hypothetical protein H6Q12_466, partial [Bacteroidetes bacterium]|nr:hypothetical protein [Bacteroidota bacterium]